MSEDKADREPFRFSKEELARMSVAGLEGHRAGKCLRASEKVVSLLGSPHASPRFSLVAMHPCHQAYAAVLFAINLSNFIALEQSLEDFESLDAMGGVWRMLAEILRRRRMSEDITREEADALVGDVGDYACGECGATGCKLWRPGAEFLRDGYLRCAACLEHKFGDALDLERTDQFRSYLPAVPLRDGETVGFWSYGSVPILDAIWWKCLPDREIQEEEEAHEQDVSLPHKRG